MLAAACLEQTGIHPLILVIPGHAFVGAWLVDECFADCTVDDTLRLRKRVEVGEVCVFEATALTRTPPVSFDRSLAEGKRHLEDTDQPLCAVDICRARRSKIRPLPLLGTGEPGTAEQGGHASPEAGGPPVTSIQLPGIPPAQGDDAPPETPASRLDRWKRRLLDLSLRNRLLNFRETRKSLCLLCPSLADLEDALADGERFRVLPQPQELQGEQVRVASVHRQRTGEDLEAEILRGEFKSHRLRAPISETELGRRLLEIYRETRTSLEESGANTLYLALGFLSWTETPGSAQRRLAPLLLVPLEIERRSVQEGFAIRQGDDDPMVNATLLTWLEKDHGLVVPGLDPLPRDDRGLDVPAILHRFRQAVLENDGWEILETAYIGHFSFTKFLMWRDLEARAADLERNKVVTHLVNTPNARFPSEGAFPDPDQLDDTHPPQQTFCPLSSDSSQLAAVYAAADGRSFVLHGPPGTGKSQTITNMIAHALACGKSVLFVSEKAAALDVVRHRLEQSGLGPFCLELHSNKSHKRDVLRQLREALECVEAHSTDEWLREATRLAALREGLNSYVRALHQVRPTGESVFRALSRLIGLREVPQVRLGWDASIDPDRSLLDRLREIARRMETAAVNGGHPSTHPWAPAACEEWSPVWRNEVEAAIVQLDTARAGLLRAAGHVAPLLHMGDSAWSQCDLDALCRLAEALLRSPAPPTALVADPDWQALSASLTEWIEHGRRRDALRRQLYEHYTEGILKLDLEALRQRLAVAKTAWVLPRMLGIRAVRGALARAAQPGQRVPSERLDGDLATALALRDKERMLDQAGECARGLLGRFWQDGAADWDQLAGIHDWTASVRAIATQVASTDLERAAALRQHWARLVSEAQDQIRPGGPIGTLLHAYIDAATPFEAARQRLGGLLRLDAASAWGDPSASDALDTMGNRLERWRSSLDSLHEWCYWRAVRREALEANLGPLVSAYEEGCVPADRIVEAFERSFSQWWVERVTAADPALRGFLRHDFERKVKEFRAADERYTALTRAEIRARLSTKVPQAGDRLNENSEPGVLRHQMGLQHPRMPIRQLFGRIPNLLPRLKPCLLMSPLSVAQYLDPAHPPFDLVVFDEASQMPVWDAVGAIARGCHAVIVGDPKQLPPTTFFERVADEDVPDEDAVEDLESILDDCRAAQLPEMHLRWHYRSRHESLIAFSNHHYYENSLLTFPSPSAETAVSFRLVAGQYDKGGARNNRIEADAVVAEILRRLQDPELSRRSLGVVTFSVAQQLLIDDLLEDARRQHPETEPFFAAGNGVGEPVFIKNLENVQGDERDVILFSVCYGPNAQGRVSMNFGPLNRDGGERRLNVAITRARHEVVVFSSLGADQIDLSRTKARGVDHLKCFLDYAERGPAALAERVSASPGGECESPFEEQVCRALRDRGHTVHPQVGCSGYRIDLAVIDPERPGRYLLGIECDGANYHRARTARDRDRLREGVLRDLGWRIHRIWSTEWWERPDRELARIESAIEEAARNRDQRPATAPAPPVAAAPRAPVAAFGPHAESRPAPVRAEAPLYVPFRLARPVGDLDAFYAPPADHQVVQAVEAVVKAEGPVSLEVAVRRVAECWGIRRIGHKVQERIERQVKRANVQRYTLSGKVFLWPKDLDPVSYRAFRRAGEDTSSVRDASDIPPEEIANAALQALQDQISLPASDLAREAGRLLGFQQVTQVREPYLRAGIDLLCCRGDAREQDGYVVLPK